MTKQVQFSMATAIRSGATFKDAALACGISPSTAQEWMARGQDVDPDRPSQPIFVEFVAAIREAGAVARVMASNRLFEKDPGRWLAHTDPQSWGFTGLARQEPEPTSHKEDLS